MDKVGSTKDGDVLVLMTDAEWNGVEETFTHYGNEIDQKTFILIANACKAMGGFKRQMQAIISLIEEGETK